MRRRQRVAAGGQPGRKAKDAVGVGDREERVLDHTAVGKHPRMHVAFNAEEGLRFFENKGVHLSFPRLSDVVLWIQPRHDVNIVELGI